MVAQLLIFVQNFVKSKLPKLIEENPHFYYVGIFLSAFLAIKFINSLYEADPLGLNIHFFTLQLSITSYLK